MGANICHVYYLGVYALLFLDRNIIRKFDEKNHIVIAVVGTWRYIVGTVKENRRLYRVLFF